MDIETFFQKIVDPLSLIRKQNYKVNSIVNEIRGLDEGNSRHIWDVDSTKQAWEMYKAGETVKTIAITFSKTPAQISSKMYTMKKGGTTIIEQTAVNESKTPFARLIKPIGNKLNVEDKELLLQWENGTLKHRNIMARKLGITRLSLGKKVSKTRKNIR